MRERLGPVAGSAMALLLVVASAVALTAGATSSASPLGPGCGGLAVAVAHRPGGVVVSPQPAGALQPCGVSTGYPAAESHIVVANDGTVVSTPAVLPSGINGTGEGPSADSDTQGNASPAGLAASSDLGGHWSVIKPLGATWNPTDHADYVDPRTGRQFFEDYGPIPLAPQLGLTQDGPSHLLWTDDRVHWQHTVLPNLVLTENPHFTTASAPAGQPQPSGYPDVAYFCANTNVGFTSPAIAGRLCFRSLDGGSTWSQTSQLLSALAPRHPECGASGETFSAVDGYYPEATRDGSLYVLVACGGRTFLARSTDEAATFPVVRTASGPVTVDVPIDSITAIGSGPQLRIGPDDTFYLVYPQVAGSRIVKLFVRVSADRGLSWGAPLDVTAPGVTGILRWAVAVSASSPGQLGFAYLGQRSGQHTWDAYLTASAAGTHDLSMWWSGVADAQPMLYGDTIQGAGHIALGQGQIAVPYPFPLGIDAVGPVVAGNDFIGATVGPDGTVWGSFNQDCGPSASTPGCVADQDQTRGVVARLATAAPPGLSASAKPSTGQVGAVRASNGAGGLAATGMSRAWPAVGLALGIPALALRMRRRRRSSEAR